MRTSCILILPRSHFETRFFGLALRTTRPTAYPPRQAEPNTGEFKIILHITSEKMEFLLLFQDTPQTTQEYTQLDSAACSAVNRVRLTTLTVQRGFLSMQSIETRSGCSCIAVHVRGPRHLSPRCSLAVYCTTCDRPLSRPQAKAASSSGSRP